ncbi:hypothetical protein EV645_2227 [Kribbella rubisoli]|uniref:Uncharacterized protein n=1 Tax=Kribbella rubisoli TaxID=3075929 RepID=A0A4Q7XA21_9ACTN|nr:hypothetical protein [Kribbella rubisoli]RZU20007.1 hypothetical protein EV645_2227 [Kribbella rubisoli]
MKLLRALPALALPLTLLTSPAQAAPTETACTMDLGSITSRGVVQYRTVTATQPATVSSTQRQVTVFSPGQARLSTIWNWSSNLPSLESGIVVTKSNFIGQASYNSNTAEPADPSFTQISAGWGPYSAIGLSVDADRRTARNQFYGLSNGTIHRWVINSFGWTPTGQTGGFSAVKTWALLGQSTTYDTFLATTRGGALYTIRLPLTKAMTPVVKQVRSGTWGAFDYLVAQRCGQVSTLLIGVDKDAGTAYLYAMSHANGSSTVIQSLGKLPGTYTDPIYFLRTHGTDLRGD